MAKVAATTFFVGKVIQSSNKLPLQTRFTFGVTFLFLSTWRHIKIRSPRVHKCTDNYGVQ